MKKLFVIIFIALSFFKATAQDMQYAYNIIKEISSPKYYGRGYVNSGDSITAIYLATEFKNIQLKKFNKSYYQSYTTSVNRIIEMPVLMFDTTILEPIKDFIVIPSSPDIENKFKIEWVTARTLTNQWVLRHFLSDDHSDKFICIDSTGLNNPELYAFANTIFSKNYNNAAGIIEASGRLKYTARTKLNDYVHLQIKPDKIVYGADSVYIKISNDFVDEYNTQNIIGYIEGKSDSIVMITAHYDHLGMFGNIMFPGANDNASGVAMVLNLAQHFKTVKNLPYTMVFVLFSGEEAGLLGSEYMSENPPFDLSLVKALLNFDMVGTGDEGVYMFNAKEYPLIDSLMLEMNKDKDYFEVMHTTGATWSSDHAPFYDKGVSAVFVYTSGNNSNYHQPEDVFEDLSFAAYKNIFRFVIDFVNKL